MTRRVDFTDTPQFTRSWQWGHIRGVTVKSAATGINSQLSSTIELQVHPS